MKTPRVCGYCGQELPGHAPEGLCPMCLLDLGAAELGTSLEMQKAECRMQNETGEVGEQRSEVRSPDSLEASNAAEESEQKAGVSGQRSVVSGRKTEVRGQRFGNYELLEKIGQGGMGVVYRARQLNLDRMVAVKLLPFGQFSREEVVQRFRAEAAAAASLQHPNIVAIHDVGEHEGQHFFSMDLVEGHTLAELVQDQPLSAKRAAGYLKTIAEAVHYAHQHGILHRDLKPSNILIDATDQPRITDFGLAKRLCQTTDRGPRTTGLTLSGQVLGSPNFMSPEQAGGSHAIGPAADIYSLGALLYHLLTRQPPFQGDTLTTLLKQVIETEPVSPRLLNPSIPRDLETICLKCLEKEVSCRYPTALELAGDLGRFLEDKPIQARPVSAAGKAWKWSRRRPALAGTGAALLLTFLLGFVAVLWEWGRTKQMAQAELHQRQRAEAGERFARQNTYAADMHLAQLALADNNREFAKYLLDKYRPGGKAETDLRGWEWRYLWQFCQGEESFKLHRFEGAINGLAISKDGKVLAVATGQELALWDLTTRRPLTRLPIGVTPALAFSPTDNLLAMGTWNGAVDLWDVNAAKVTMTLTYGGKVRSLAFSPDGKLLATFDTEGKVRIADWASGQNLAEFLVPPTRYTSAGVVVFSPDGSRLAIGEDYGRLRLLDLRTTNFVQLPTQTSAGITAAAFSPHSELLAAAFGYGEGTIRLWDARSGELRGQLTNHTADVTALAFTSDGRHLASASHDGTIRIWGVTDYTEVHCLRGSPEGLTALTLLPDRRTLVSGGSGGSVCFWDIGGRSRVPVHTNLAVSLGFEAFVGLEHSDFAPETLDPRAVRRFGLAFTPDSRSFITMDSGGALARWDARSWRLVEDLPAFGSNHWSVALSPNGRWLATGDFPGRVTIWDWTTRHSVTNFAIPFEWFGLLHFSRSGHYFIGRFGCNNYTFNVRLWRTGDWSEVPLPAAQSAWLWSVDVSPDDRLLAGGYADGAVRLFRFPSGEHETTFTQQKGSVLGLHFSPDGQVLCSTSFDGSAALWDVLARRPMATLRGHRGMALGSALSPDGRRLATGGSTPSEAVKLWDLAAQRELLSLPGEGGWYMHVTFSSDGNTLAATALSGRANLWRAPSWEEIEAAERDKSAKEGATPETVPPSGFAHPEALASTQWLEEHLRDPAVRIVDARFGQSDSAFSSGHIPGAVPVAPLTDLRDTTKTNVYSAPPPAQFEALMSRLGISNTNTVVVYDAEGGLWCARLWWLLRYYGHRDAKLLHGGLGKWRLENHPLESTITQPVRSAFRARAQPELRAAIGQVRDAVGKTNVVILDALPADHFSGKQPMMPGLPAGHIPSAKNVPAPSNLNAAQQLLPTGKLAAMYSQVGVTRGIPVITYCGGGYYGAFTFFVLYQLGYESVRLYDGSWAEWISEGGAVETGP